MPATPIEITDDIVYGRQALRNYEPWIVPESLTMLRHFVQPNFSVFEWGSGGSTIFFAQHCASIISIEHNPEWITRVGKMIIDSGVANVTLKYIPMDLTNERPYANYANAILDYPDDSFDIVFVDGDAAARYPCIMNSLPRVKVGGWLLLDNSDWFKGDLGDNWPRVDYVAKDLKWIGQPGTFDWWTSIFRRMG